MNGSEVVGDKVVGEQAQVVKAQATAKKYGALKDILTAVIVFISLVMAYSSWRHDVNSSEDNGREIAALRVDLEAARLELGKFNSEASELTRCNGAFATLIQETSYKRESAIGQLLVSMLQTLQTPLDQRVQGSMDVFILRVSTANAEYQDAVIQRTQWTEAGSPLPYPLT